MRYVRDTHVGTTNGSPVADLTLYGAALYNISSEEGALRETQHVNLSHVEIRVSEQVGACLFSLIHEVISHGSE